MSSKIRNVEIVIHATWISSILIFAALGVAGREILIARDVPVVAWNKGLALFLPLALLHLVPVLLYSFLLRRACLNAFSGKGSGLTNYLLAVVAGPISVSATEESGKFISAIAGACSALVLATAGSLFGTVLYSGPGGFAEAVILMLAMFPLTIGYMLIVGLVSMGIGGALGGWTYEARRRFLPRSR